MIIKQFARLLDLISLETLVRLLRGWQIDHKKLQSFVEMNFNKCEESNKTNETQREQKFSDPFLAKMRIN